MAEAINGVTTTTAYGYDTDNRVTSITVGDSSKSYTYDQIGNPLSDGTRSYTWRHGRQLATLTEDGTTWTNTYNAGGLRTRRTDGTDTYVYVYDGSSLAYMSYNDKVMRFAHAPDGTPLSIVYRGRAYYYVTNLQGDVVGLVNSSGVLQVAYSYDAWGNILSTTGPMANTLGVHNPLRYRGYVYDPETALYYLQSRYYDPNLGRFLNTDAFAATGQGLLGNNMFTYCLNNPIMHRDSTGEEAMLIVAGATLVSVESLLQVAVGVLAVCAIVWVVTEIVSSVQVSFSKIKNKNKYDPDPYGRSDQKKQGRENKSKNREMDNYTPRNNRRDGKPRRPKHHTPARDYQKYSRAAKGKMDLLYKQIG